MLVGFNSQTDFRYVKTIANLLTLMSNVISPPASSHNFQYITDVKRDLRSTGTVLTKVKLSTITENKIITQTLDGTRILCYYSHNKESTMVISVVGLLNSRVAHLKPRIQHLVNQHTFHFEEHEIKKHSHYCILTPHAKHESWHSPKAIHKIRIREGGLDAIVNTILRITK